MMISKRNIFHFQVSIVRWYSTPPESHQSSSHIFFPEVWLDTTKKNRPRTSQLFGELGMSAATWSLRHPSENKPPSSEMEHLQPSTVQKNMCK